MNRSHTAIFVTKAQHDALCDLLDGKSSLTPRMAASLIDAGLLNRRWWQISTGFPLLTERGEAYVAFHNASAAPRGV